MLSTSASALRVAQSQCLLARFWCHPALLLAAVLPTLLLSPAQGADAYWTGSSNANWTGANWSSALIGAPASSVPDESAAVIFSATGAAHKDIILDVDTTIYSLLSADDISLSSPAGQSHTLTLGTYGGTELGVTAGTLTLNPGVTLATTALNFGYVQVMVSGASGATLTFNGGTLSPPQGSGAYFMSLHVGGGGGGTGTLNVQNGSALTLGYGSSFSLGVESGDIGTITVDGAGSSITGGNVFVGGGGTGALTVKNGGQTSALDLYVAYDTGSAGTVLVDGAGSVLNAGRADVGISGNGKLILSNGGVANLESGEGTLYLGSEADGVGALIIGGGSATAGTLNAAQVDGGSGTAQLNFNQTDDIIFAPQITGSVAVMHNGPGVTTLAQANTYYGGTTLNGGTLVTRNASALGTGHVALSGGTLRAVGALNIGDPSPADLTWGPGAHIALAPAHGDVINVSGAFKPAVVSSGGAYSFTIDPTGMALDQPYTLVNYGSSTFSGPGDFSAVFTDPNFIYSYSILLGPGSGSPYTGSVLLDLLSIMPRSDGLLHNFQSGVRTTIDYVVNGNIISGRTADGEQEAHTIINSLIVPGGGRLTVPSVNTLSVATGTSIYNGGFVNVNGVLQSPQVTVYHGGFLEGNGLIVGNVLNRGTVAPGNSPGTLTIHGNYTQTPSGTLQIQIAGRNNFDHLIVSGRARLAGTLDVQSLGAKLAYGDQYPFLQAGSISGRFSRIKISSPRSFRGRFLTEGGTGILLVAPASYTLVAHNANETSLARALDKWIGIETGDVGEVTLALDLLKEEQYASAFAAISPAYYGYIAQTNMEKTISNNQLLGQRLSALRGGARGVSVQGAGANSFTGSSAKDAKGAKQVSVTNSDEARWGSFVQLTGQFADVQTTGILGDQGKSSMGGALIGADYRLSERTVIGLSLGYDVTWLNDQTQSNNSIDTESLTAYGSMGLGHGFFVNGTLGASYSSYSVKRPIVFSSINRTATADTNGRQLFASVEFGKDIKAGHWTFTPSTGIQYTDLSIDGTNESGAGAIGLKLGNVSANSLRFHVGAQIAYEAKLSANVTAVPYVHASWQHEFSDKALSIRAMLAEGGGAFNYTSAPLSRDRALVGAGVNFLIGPAITLNIGYQADLSDNYTSQLIFLQLGYKF